MTAGPRRGALIGCLTAALALAATATLPAANLILHLDAGGLALADGASVAAWGGLTQGDAVRQPTYQAANPAFNNQPTVNFDGLDNPNGDFMSGMAVNNTQTVIAVTRLRTGAGSLDTLISTGSDSNNIRRNDSSNFYRSPQRGQNAGDYSNAGGHLTVNGVGSGAFVFDQSHLMVAQSAAPRSYGNFHLGTATSGGGGAQNRYWTGDVAEVMVFDGVLPRNQRWAVESSLAQKYALGNVANLFAQNPAAAGDTIFGTAAANATEVLGNLFDFLPNTKYFVSSTSTPQFGYSFGGGLTPVGLSYSLTSANDSPGRDPRAWILEGSNDGVVWDVLDQREDITFAQRFQSQTFDVMNPGAYASYRMTILENNGQANQFQLADWNMYGILPEPGRAMLLLIGALALVSRRRR